MSGFGDLNRVNTNVQSLDAQLSLNKINKNLSDNQLRLSTGLRINRAEDDSAGFSIATKLNSRVAGLEQALQNVGDAKSVLDIAEASFDTIIDNLIEMKSLATQAANDTLGEDERGYIGQQIAELGSEINEIANQTVFQDLELLNGAEGGHGGSLSLTFQTGEHAQDTITTNIDAVNIKQLFGESRATGTYEAETATVGDATDFDFTDSISIGVGSESVDINVGSITEIAAELNNFFADNKLTDLSAEVVDNGGTDEIVISNYSTTDSYTVSVDGNNHVLGIANFDEYHDEDGQGEMQLFTENAGEKEYWGSNDFRSFLSEIDGAIGAMADRVNAIGVSQSSLSTRELTLSQAISSNTSASSRIMDADFAKEQSESIRLQILQQTATSALAQANMGPQSVLGFLG